MFLSLSYVLGDGVTTYAILADPGLVESNPAVLALLDVGGIALFAIAKLLVVAISIGLFLVVGDVVPRDRSPRSGRDSPQHRPTALIHEKALLVPADARPSRLSEYRTC